MGRSILTSAAARRFSAGPLTDVTAAGVAAAGPADPAGWVAAVTAPTHIAISAIAVITLSSPHYTLLVLSIKFFKNVKDWRVFL